MFDYGFAVLTVCLLLAVVCALFGDDVRSARGLTVLRELLHLLRRHDDGERE